MNIDHFISSTRLGCEHVPETEDHHARNEFKRDFDRIIFSSAFRRLQGKTQVFPFPENDSTHNRLTHSLEVYSIGRSLGTKAGNLLKINILAEYIGDIVGAAALGHDIGNSPFGHSGEVAISRYFENDGSNFIAGFSPQQKSDFLNFEGNAVGFSGLRPANRDDFLKN